MEKRGKSGTAAASAPSVRDEDRARQLCAHLDLSFAHALADLHGVLHDHGDELLDGVFVARLGDDARGASCGVSDNLVRKPVLGEVIGEGVHGRILAEQVPEPGEDPLGVPRVVVHGLLGEPSIAAGEGHRGGGLALRDLVDYDRYGRPAGRDDGHLDVLGAVVDAEHRRVNRGGAAQEQRDGGEQVTTQPHGVDVQRRARSRVARRAEASPQQKKQRACVTNAGQSAVRFFLSWLSFTGRRA